MKLKLNKETGVSVDSWINDRLITDKSWECWHCDNADGGFTIVLKEPNNGPNSVKLIFNKKYKI